MTKRDALLNMRWNAQQLHTAITDTLQMLEECGELEIHGCLDNVDVRMMHLRESMGELNRATGNHFTKAYYQRVDQQLAGSCGDLDPTT